MASKRKGIAPAAAKNPKAIPGNKAPRGVKTETKTAPAAGARSRPTRGR